MLRIAACTRSSSSAWVSDGSCVQLNCWEETLKPPAAIHREPCYHLVLLC